MPSLNGITARVFCEGSALEDYATLLDPDKPSVVSCWIASTADKESAIQYEFETQESWGWSCYLHCDGVVMVGKALKPQRKRYIQGKASSGDKAYSIMFSEIVETDSQEGVDHGNPNVGLIEIEVWRIEEDWEVVNRTLKKITMDESPIHESKKMLGGHRIRLGEPKLRRLSLGNHARPVFLDDRPYRIFRFYYRPISLLRALGHAPIVSSTPLTAVKRSASVLSDSSSKSDAESDSDAEDERIAKLKREINACQEKWAKITQNGEAKPSKHGRRKAKKLKREEVPIVVPPSAMEGVIDLCSD